MRPSTRMAAGLITGFLISAPYAPAFSASQGARDSQTAMADVTIQCEPLSWDAANKLPWFIKPSQVECMSPTQDDLQANTQARSAGYAVGRYVEAVSHFDAAAPSVKP